MDRATQRHSDRARSAQELLVEFEHRRGGMRRSLAEALRTAIQDGRLSAATRLPSSRRLAADVGVSRGVVSDTYEQLASEGYLEIAPRFAPTVASVVTPLSAPREAAAAPWKFDFHATTPDLGLFPRRAWLRAVEHALRIAPDLALDYGDNRGRIELREALSSYLGRVRGVRVDPSRIVITQGFTQGLDLLCRALADRGATTVAIESPSHPELWSTIRRSGLRLVGCPVDADGLRTDALQNLAVDAVVVAPAHQYPTGAVMTAARRVELVRWAAGRGGLVIEDDYDAEFRYDRRPVGSIQGLDPIRVAHIGSASKTLAPAVRLGWASVPADLVEAVRTEKTIADSGSPAIDQLALAHLISTGVYERHVIRARHEYRRRRDHLVRALSRALSGYEVRGAAAGMRLLLRLPEGVDDVAIEDAAASRGIGLRALSPLHLTPSSDRGLLLGYGRLPESRIDRAVSALRSVIEVGTEAR